MMTTGQVSIHEALRAESRVILETSDPQRGDYSGCQTTEQGGRSASMAGQGDSRDAGD